MTFCGFRNVGLDVSYEFEFIIGGHSKVFDKIRPYLIVERQNISILDMGSFYI